MYNIGLPVLRYVWQNIQSKRIYIKNNRLKSSTRAVYCSVLTGRLLVNGYKDVKLSYFAFPCWTFWNYYPTYRNATACYTTWDAARQLPKDELFKRNIVLRDRGSLYNLKIETLKSHHCGIFRFRRFNLKVEQIWRNCIVHVGFHGYSSLL